MVARQYSRLLTLLISLFTLPFVSAYYQNTGISPLNRVVELIANMSNIPVLQNELVQIGVMRFALFILFMTVARWSFKFTFKGKEGNKTAGILAAVMAAIGAWFMPESWVIGNGGVIAAIFTGLIPIGLVCAVIYLSVTKLNQNTAGRLIAIVLLLTVLAIIQIWFDITGAVGVGSTATAPSSTIAAPAAPAPATTPPTTGTSTTGVTPEESSTSGVPP